MSPKTISNLLILLLKKRGSINDTKKAPVLIVTRATEILDTLMALKKKIQCNAITTPVRKNFPIPIRSALNDFFFMTK